MTALSPTLRAQLAALPVPTLSAVLYARGLRSRFLYGITPAAPDAPRLVGLAFPVRAIPVREDIRDAVARGEVSNPHRLAFGAAPAGSVIVCATGGAARVSLLGDIIATALRKRGVAGVVTDTGVADLPAVAGIGLPVFHAGGSAPVPSGALVMVVDHDLPVGIAGVAVFPGDVMVGDANGVVCIPRAIAEAVAEEAAAKLAMEDWIQAEIAAGGKLEALYPPDAATKARYAAWKGRAG